MPTEASNPGPLRMRSTKDRCRQNIGVNKILALTKYMHTQKLQVQRASPYCFVLAKSTVAGSDLAGVLLLKMLSPHAVAK